MKQGIKKVLKNIGVYYFLQGNYRAMLFQLNTMFNRIKYARYIGAGFVCNFCDSQYTRFAPRYPAIEDEAAIKKYHIITGDGENVYCPNCGSTCRERLVLQALKTSVDYNHKLILHLSPEKKIYDFLKDKASVITTDIEPGFYRIIDKKVRYADATQLPFADNSFDIVIANHVMEHIPDDIKAMSEIYRVLKPRGSAIMQVPFSNTIAASIEEPLINDPAKQSVLFGQKDHVRIYTMNDYISRLSKAGFTTTYIEPTALEQWQIFALQKEEGLVKLTKTA